MFVTVSAVTAILDNNIRYVYEARENNLGDDNYYSMMHDKIYKGLEKLKEISCNRKLIAKYETKVNELFK